LRGFASNNWKWKLNIGLLTTKRVGLLSIVPFSVIGNTRWIIQTEPVIEKASLRRPFIGEKADPKICQLRLFLEE
jgi:hypothetical protein